MIWVERLIATGDTSPLLVGFEPGIYRVVGYAHSAMSEGYNSGFFMGVLVDCDVTAAHVILPVTAGAANVAILRLSGQVKLRSYESGSAGQAGCALSFEKLGGHE